MIELPETEAVPVLRIDFSDDATWHQVWDTLSAADADSGYVPALEAFERRDLVGMDSAELERQIPRLFPEQDDRPFVVIVDALSITSPEHHVLLIDLSAEDTAPSFRCVPQEVASIEANLSIANVDFIDLSDDADDDGVFRGYE